MAEQTQVRMRHDGPAASIRHWARVGYFLVAWLYVVFVLIQVFLAGLSVFVSSLNWARHVAFGHLLGPLGLTLLLLALIGRAGWPTFGLTFLLGLLYGMQYVFVEVPPIIGLPELSALHPVNALIIFYLALHLATRSRRFLAKVPPATASGVSMMTK